jgi:hypothetical protein
MNAGHNRIFDVKIFHPPFYSIILRTETREEANNNITFSGKDWLTTGAKSETSASSCCPCMHGVQNF